MILIDADSLVYKVGFSCMALPEKMMKDGTTRHARHGQPLSIVLYRLDTMVAEIVLAAGESEEYCLYLTTNLELHREDIAVTQPYKGNRAEAVRPTYYKEMRDHLINKYKAILRDNGYEADDVIATVADNYRAANQEYVIAHIDKDLNQIPGEHYDYGSKTWYDMDELAAARSFWMQMLTGDPVDNIRGLEGIGPVKAGKIMQNCTSDHMMHGFVRVNYYQYMQGDWEARFTENYNLLKLGVGVYYDASKYV